MADPRTALCPRSLEGCSAPADSSGRCAVTIASVRHRFAPLLVLALIAGGCSSSDGGDDSTGASAEASSTGSDAGASKAESVPVTLQPDAATATTTTIGADGGTIGATASDGTAYALQIPKGALPGTVDITMTPLAGMTGLPKGAALTFGVSLEPEGLVFAKPSWLYVTDDAKPDDLFSGLSVDHDLATLSGAGYDGERFVLAVSHFSGAGGVGCLTCGGPGTGWPGLPGPGGGTTPPPPGQPGGGPLGPTGGGWPPFEPPTTPPGPGPSAGEPGGQNGRGGSLTDGLGGGQPSGGGDLNSQIKGALSDLGNAQLTGDEEAEQRATEKLDKLKGKIKDEVWKNAEACVNEKDITKLKELIYWETIGQLLGYAKDDDEESKLLSLIETCNRFEMDSKGEMIFTLGGDVFRIGDSMDLKIPLLMQGQGYEGNASGTVKPLGYDRGFRLR